MTTEALTRIDLPLLLGEARRYLATVDAFRAEGCEPSWRQDQEPEPVGPALAAPASLIPSR
jgi:hypothetical protein